MIQEIELSLEMYGYDSARTRYQMEGEAAMWRDLRLKRRYTGPKGEAG
jgi:hypothetical protein